MTRSLTVGWIRLGIVLSCAWLVAVLTYTTFDFYQINSEEAGWKDEPTIGAPSVVPAKDIRPLSPLTECGHDGKQLFTTCAPRYANLTLLILGPIATGWLVVLLTVYPVLWVRAGFRGKET